MLSYTLKIRLISVLLQNWQKNRRRIFAVKRYPLRSFLKLRGGCHLIILDKRLRVSRDQREPGALDLNHDPVSLFERVGKAGHRVAEGIDCVWRQRLGADDYATVFDGSDRWGAAFPGFARWVQIWRRLRRF